MPVRPLTRDALLTELAETIAAHRADRWCRVAIDGAPPARPDALAAELVDPLRTRGRAALHVRAGDFLRPASLRFEHGRTDPDAFRTDWLDTGGLTREALDPLEPGGSGRVLPALWDASTDRASRAAYVELPPGGVLMVAGSLLLGRGLPVDMTVHLAMSEAALARHTDRDDLWTLPAYHRYATEVAPEENADVVVLMDHPERPAVRHNRVAGRL